MIPAGFNPKTVLELNILSNHRFVVDFLLDELLRKEIKNLVVLQLLTPYVVEHCSILDKPDISVVVNDMDGSNGVLFILLTDLNVLLSTHIVAIEVDSRAGLE